MTDQEDHACPFRGCDKKLVRCVDEDAVRYMSTTPCDGYCGMLVVPIPPIPLTKREQAYGEEVARRIDQK